MISLLLINTSLFVSLEMGDRNDLTIVESVDVLQTFVLNVFRLYHVISSAILFTGFSVSVDSISIYMFWQLIELKMNKFEIPSIIAMVGYYTIKLEKRLFFHHCDLRISMFIKWNCELCQVMLTWSIKSKKLVMVCFYWKIEFRQTVWSEYISRRVICMEWVFLSSLEHIFHC